jgi:putative membrane protein
VKGLLFLLFVLIFLVIGWFIGAQNNHLVLINYILAETQIRMSVLLAISFFIGVIFTFILLMLYILRLKWQVSTLERKNKKLSALAKSQ